MDGADAGRDARPDRACPEAVSATATVRRTKSACRRCAADCPPSRRVLNPVRTFIPVAAVSDMLLHPGEQFDYNGRTLTYPDIKCVYWAGGNPFHHHQNLPRLRRALGRVDTVVVHDPYWTAMAKHADIVVPSTTPFERDDYSGSRNDPLLMAMPALAEPYARVARRLHDVRGAGRATRLRRRSSPRAAPPASGWCTCTRSGRPDSISRSRPFDEFWAAGHLRLPTETGLSLLADFRADPVAHRLGHAQRAHRDLLRRHRRIRLRRLRGPSDVVRARRVAGRRARRRPIRCTCWPISPRRGCTASSTAARPAWTRRCKGANRFACIPTTPRRRGAVRRRRGAGVQRPRRVPGRPRRRRRDCATASCSCRPAPGTTPRIRPTPTRCACTATPTC